MKACIFDLDGTLTDTLESSANTDGIVIPHITTDFSNDHRTCSMSVLKVL